jgi:hypothetical protein
VKEEAMTKRRLAALVALAAIAGALTFASVGVAAPPSTNCTPIPTNISTDTSTFIGDVNICQFVVQNGQIVAVGTVTGTLTNLLTGVTTTITQDVVLPLLSVSGTCQILHLELGPLDLNVLGVMVHLDKVVLDISAEAAPGQLLGNLLCTVAHLLDTNVALTALTNLLNRLLILV